MRIRFYLTAFGAPVYSRLIYCKMNVFVVIHEREPSDSGSDFGRASMLPSRFDTEIIGLYSSFRKAKRAAETYLENVFGDLDEDKLSGIDWLGDGWSDDTDVGEGGVIGPSTDRIHIEEYALDKAPYSG